MQHAPRHSCLRLPLLQRRCGAVTGRTLLLHRHWRQRSSLHNYSPAQGRRVIHRAKTCGSDNSYLRSSGDLSHRRWWIASSCLAAMHNTSARACAVIARVSCALAEATSSTCLTTKQAYLHAAVMRTQRHFTWSRLMSPRVSLLTRKRGRKLTTNCTSSSHESGQEKKEVQQVRENGGEGNVISEEVQTRAAVLGDLLNAANRVYYSGEDPLQPPIMSDQEYDNLYAELEAIEGTYSVQDLSKGDQMSPTQYVGYDDGKDRDITGRDSFSARASMPFESVDVKMELANETRAGQKHRQKVAHRGSPMLSLNNVATLKGVASFQSFVRRQLRLAIDASIHYQCGGSGSGVKDDVTEKNDTSVNSLQYIIERKFDGVALSLLYMIDNGGGIMCLTQAATRGNGWVGDDVTDRVSDLFPHLRVLHVPPELLRRVKAVRQSRSQLTVMLRGEAVLSRKQFQVINEQREEKGLSPFLSPRNLVAGMLLRKLPGAYFTPSVPCSWLQSSGSATAAAPDLDIMFYGLSVNVVGRHNEGANVSSMDVEHICICSTHTECLHFLEALGVSYDTEAHVASDDALIPALEGAIAHWEGRRATLAVDIDGLVVKVNDLRRQNILGVTSKAPRWALAFKFSPDKAVSEVVAIHMQVGRSGRVTPVAEIRPVRIGGCVAKRATLHNMGMLDELALQVGDIVDVERRGDVIPYVSGKSAGGSQLESALSSEASRQTRQAPLLRFCPCEHSTLLQKRIGCEDSSELFCVSLSCPRQAVYRLAHFASRGCMDIPALGLSSAQALFRAEVVTHYLDILTLSRRFSVHSLQKALGSGWGVKRSTRLLHAIDQAIRVCSPMRLLTSLGIRGVGPSTAAILLQEYGSVECVLSANVNDLQARVSGIGPSTAETLAAFACGEDGLHLRSILNKVHVPAFSKAVSICATAESRPEVVLTGKMRGWSNRRDLMQLLREQCGLIVKTAVSRRTSFVIVGDVPSAKKLSEAQKRGVAVRTLESVLQEYSAT